MGLSTAWRFYNGFPVLFHLWCHVCCTDSSKSLWNFPGSVEHLWCLLRTQCVWTEATSCCSSGDSPSGFFPIDSHARGTQLHAGPGAPGMLWDPSYPVTTGLAHYILIACQFAWVPPPLPPDCELSEGRECDFLVVLQGLARAQRMLLLE